MAMTLQHVVPTLGLPPRSRCPWLWQCIHVDAIDLIVNPNYQF